MVRLSALTTATCLALIPRVLGVDYPATIEVDLIFPRNETYNNMTTFPIIFALQNADAALAFGYTIDWEFVWLGGDEDEKFLDAYTGPDISDSIYLSDFKYTHDDLVLVAGKVSNRNGYYLRPGTYLVQWTYDTVTCSVSDTTTTYHIGGDGYVAMGGNVVFTAVADGSGLGFEVPVDECPLYSGQWTAGDGTNTCPELSSFDAEPDPCKAQLGQEQIDCLQDWYRGNNESEACTASLVRWDVESRAASVAASVFSAALAIWLVEVAIWAL
ncbi:hypothetical protein BJX65DRAFT_311897 [Aspergillus insuetus]